MNGQNKLTDCHKEGGMFRHTGGWTYRWKKNHINILNRWKDKGMDGLSDTWADSDECTVGWKDRGTE
jgi:hypothetical protein